MQNLQLLGEQRHEYDCLRGEEGKGDERAHVARDATTGRVCLAGVSDIACLEEDRKIWVQPLAKEEDICTLHFSPEHEAFFVAYISGELCLMSEGGAETVGCIAEGISCLQWSPDEEAFVVVTQNHRLCRVHVCDWEVSAEASLQDLLEDTELEKSSTVAQISWQGDGCLVAVSLLTGAKCGVAIFDGTTLGLAACVKPEFPLTGDIVWQPNGRHLYAVGRSPDDELCMCLFEKNGLAHGSFSLRTSESMESLAWSIDSQLLAVAILGADKWILQIWMRSNWHWYLKYERMWKADCGTLLLGWDAEQSTTLHLFFTSPLARRLSLSFMLDSDVSVNGTAAVIDGQRLQLTPLRHVVIPPPMSAVEIVFGASVQCVAFFSDSETERVAVWMASDELGIGVCRNEDRWETEADENVADEDCVKLQPVELLNCSTQKDSLCLGSHLLWLDDHTIAVFGYEVGAMADKMHVVKLETVDRAYQCRWSEPVSLNFALLKPIGVYDGVLFIQSVEGKIFSASVTDPTSLQLRLEYSFPVCCPSVIIGKHKTSEAVIGMTSSGHVYHGSMQLMERATSMIKHVDRQGREFLLITTRDNKVLVKSFDNLEGTGVCLANGHSSRPDEVARPVRRSGATAGMHAAMTPALTQTQLSSFFERNIEMGARLIASPPDGVDVVFEMPRGNLEIISLRLFVLHEIIAALRDMDFARAWRLATVHRVDLNVLVDFQWPKFLSLTKEFIAAVPSSDEICDLMTALEQGSLFRPGSPYCDCLPEGYMTEQFEPNGGKVTAVCEALRAAMVEKNEEAYCKAIAISYARCNPPDLAHALQSIKAVRIREVSNSNDSVTDVAPDASSPAGEALKYLMLYVETSELYRVALGMYDLGLAYMVVTHAQRDPGEYLIELEQFTSIEPESYRCAKIDLYLHRYSSALAHLIDAGHDRIEEAVELAEEHCLFHELLSHMKPTDDHRKAALKRYGHWLKSRGMQQDAGAAFLAAEELQLALEAYQSHGEWQMTFILASKLRLPASEVQDLATEIVDELKSMERFVDAAHVCLEYLEGSEEEAIALLTEARHWKEAVRISYLSNKQELIDSIIAPSAAAAAASHLEDLAKNTEDLHKYFERLKEVQKKRETMENVVGHTGTTTLAEEEAEASTVAGLSIYTDRTHLTTTKATSSAAFTSGGKKPKKSQQSKKAKKLRIKQGSPEEEAALIAHLHQLQPDPSVLQEVSHLAEFLIFLGFFDDARQLQSSLDSFVKSHQRIVDKLPASASLPRDVTRSSRWKWDILRSAETVSSEPSSRT